MMNAAYESMTLHNIVNEVHTARVNDDREYEQYWLTRLESFLYAV